MKLNERVEDYQAFYVNYGPTIYSVAELAEALDNNQISDESFTYHVNDQNNDFVNWIRGVFHEEALANSLKRIKTKKTLAKKIKEYLEPTTQNKKSDKIAKSINDKKKVEKVKATAKSATKSKTKAGTKSTSKTAAKKTTPKKPGSKSKG